MSAYSNDSRNRSYHSSRRDTESGYRSSRSRETEFASEKRQNKRESSRRTKVLSKSEGSAGGHWNSKPKRQKSSVEDDLSQLWVCEETDPFTPLIRYFYFSKTRMPSYIKTYDENEDLEDHLKIFQAAAKTKRWQCQHGEEDGTEGPMIIDAEMGGHFVHRMYVDKGSSLEILYKHCFNIFRPEVRNQMVPATTLLVGFSREIIRKLGQISLLVKIGDEEHSTSAWMNFMV
nr:reverse transcriptase domain-containing protein [Tanacetum cinerariifolium]